MLVARRALFKEKTGANIGVGGYTFVSPLSCDYASLANAMFVDTIISLYVAMV